MTEITLLAKREATPGFQFTYMGGAPVCRTCPYRHACLTLDAGRRYRVTKVRPVEHPCALQESSASVVEVEAIPRAAVIDSRSAIVGSQIDLTRTDCHRIDCPNWQICAGPSLAPKQRFRIEKVDAEAAECRIGRSLRRAELL
ncbi:MAG: UPF0179 family protein [Thermoplasmata archaeon]|nr:UPF0179 family protein [Thermoplasmata archaeon]MCI4338443.1 UPF0179 family protein [Thermoplasmata archaeon]MCI4341856.1 UPF0179 family protein [Thermoplasmata archaeon]